MAMQTNMFNGGTSFTDLLVFKKRWWQHLVFWMLVFLVLVNIFKISSTIEKIDLIYTAFFLLPLGALTYLNLYLFIPRFLKRERYLLYIFCFILLMIGGALLLYVLFDRLIDFILPNFYFISYYSLWHLMIYSGSILLLSTLLKLSRGWFLLLRIERISTSFQLKSLQSQINPHFLLNSLQTIYALSLKKSEHTPEVILQLSDILKYTLYETENAKISLQKEIQLVRDYVDVFRYRVDPERAIIELNIAGDAEDLQIAPMLLIPFIENSFKHGLQGAAGSVKVNIHIDISDNGMEFSISNTTGEADSLKVDKRKGIGIENTRRRLELLYPGKHELEVRKEKACFTVGLKLQLND